MTPRLVHKSDPGEVYLTRWYRTGPDAFRITARWPESHAFYRVEPCGRPLLSCDPLLLCETVRQTFPLLCHAAYDVPFGHQLIWDRFAYRIEASATTRQPLDPDVTLHVECHDLAQRGSRLSALSMRLLVTRGGRRVATAETRFAVQAQTVYHRLRGERSDAARAMAGAPSAPDPIAHRLTRRLRPEDVVLSPPGQGTPDRETSGRETSGQGTPATGGTAWLLRVDTSHPVLFDHAVDHVPGMLLIEAAHQAAHAAGTGGHTEIRGVTCSFFRYVELDSPCLISATPPVPAGDGLHGVRVAATQDGQVRFSATVTYAHTGRPAGHTAA
ncbi:ScbA/BarX family gamma-butyrolactone biosynthesis protein [Streptomyces sp. HMX112]|uniref:ScbA/BarX family gamma-butyrolactone biosynthesis protein n=1 Tax=Streptomyces sp. HMX112 TaxID=3390850 RepID=UPI003A7FF912